MDGEISKKAMLGFPDRPCMPEKTVVFGPCAGDDHGEAKQLTTNRRYNNTYLRQTSSVVDGGGLEEALTRLLNRYSEERTSNTPDFILAKFLINALDTFNIAVQEREKWYGRQVW